MRQVWITRVGPPEVLELREAPDPVPKPGEVQIRVRAVGVNFADIMARLGLYPDAPKLPAVVGYEVAGDVAAVGDGASRAIGEKVFAITRFGGYSDVICVPAAQAIPLPEGMTYAEGAAIPVNYLTAYQMLVQMGSVKAGERVLVHSAAGGVGLASIDLCRIYGAEIFGTASASKHAMLRERGVSQVIDYNAQDYETEVKRLTAGRGVHIVLDAMGGEHWKKGYRCLAPTGRLVMFGLSNAATGKTRSIWSLLKTLLRTPLFSFPPTRLINDNKALLGVNLGHMWDETELLTAWLVQLLAWYRDGKIHPTVGASFPLAEAPAAHHYIQDRKNVGKVVLVP
ncbi:MAG TPA: medium chain dehydrogenase/reductase family protein [Candidatus Binatia bacterium]|nr:medium chain dehydrogenase/reductase family protein [Candidatus Binatia bacterium]